jgi:hypothetical protein
MRVVKFLAAWVSAGTLCVVIFHFLRKLGDNGEVFDPENVGSVIGLVKRSDYANLLALYREQLEINDSNIEKIAEICRGPLALNREVPPVQS